MQVKIILLLRLFADSLKQSLKASNNDKYHKTKYVSWQQKFLVGGVPHHFYLWYSQKQDQSDHLNQSSC